MRVDRIWVLIGGLLLGNAALAGMASAQTKISISEQCGRPNPEYTIQVGDHPGHVFRIEQSTCTWEGTLEIAGVGVKQHQVTGFSEMDGAKGSDHWFHVFTIANGDSVYARSQGTATYEGRRFQSSTADWTFEGGTGQFQGLKGSGSYTCHPPPIGFACEAHGEYR